MLGFGLLPTIVRASVFTFISELLKPSKLVHEIRAENNEILNSQNMPLLQAALNHDPNPSKGGGDITIVGGTALLSETGPSGSLADIEEHPASDQISIYVVREGDSLSQIAKMFGVSVNTIVWANDIKRSSLIRAGQTLVILPISGIRYTIRKGDTLQSIAKKYKGNVEEIIKYNDLASDSVLAVGDTIIIPDGEISSPGVSPAGSKRIVRGTNGPSYDGYYLRPVNGGRRTQGLHGYNAVDIGVSYGTPIFAAAAGKVIISKDYGWNGGYGKYVVIKHDNGTQTLYAHNSRNIVYAGQTVVKGQVIGYVGTTGKSTGPHVHFEIRGAKNPF
jgi:LysM repeat protein